MTPLSGQRPRLVLVVIDLFNFFLYGPQQPQELNELVYDLNYDAIPGIKQLFSFFSNKFNY